MQVTEAMIRTALRQPLPGQDAHDRLMPFKRPTPQAAKAQGRSPKIGAVMMLVYPDAGELHTVLMRRPTYPGVHSGQISFPGGKQEPEDPDHQFTALRETEEEVGVAPSQVEVLGKWTSLYIPPSNFIMHPYLGWTPEKPTWVPDPREVDAVLETPLSLLLDPVTLEKRKVPTGVAGTRIEVAGFALESDFVWGATAMVLMEFRTVLESLR